MHPNTANLNPSMLPGCQLHQGFPHVSFLRVKHVQQPTRNLAQLCHVIQALACSGVRLHTASSHELTLLYVAFAIVCTRHQFVLDTSGYPMPFP